MRIFLFNKKTVIALIVIALITSAICVGIVERKKAVQTAKNGITVVIDAGHGGIDGGVVGKNSGVKESEINLKIAKMLGSSLSRKGYNCVLTRKDGNGLYQIGAKSKKLSDMQKRKEIINSSSADLMISIHQNYFSSSSVKGAQVFFAQNNEKSGTYAGIFQTEFNAFCSQNKQAKLADYYVLQCSIIPSILVECGFLSNAEDEKNLTTPSYREKLVEMMATTVDKIFNQTLL